MITTRVSKQTYKLPEALAKSVAANLQDWRDAGKVRRLWQGDASLWTGKDEAGWLGWLEDHRTADRQCRYPSPIGVTK